MPNTASHIKIAVALALTVTQICSQASAASAPVPVPAPIKNLIANPGFEATLDAYGIRTGGGFVPGPWITMGEGGNGADTFSFGGSYGLPKDNVFRGIASAFTGDRWVGGNAGYRERFGQKLAAPLEPDSTYCVSAGLHQASNNSGLSGGPNYDAPGGFHVYLASFPAGAVTVNHPLRQVWVAKLGVTTQVTDLNPASWNTLYFEFETHPSLLQVAGLQWIVFEAYAPETAIGNERAAYTGIDGINLVKRGCGGLFGPIR